MSNDESAGGTDAGVPLNEYQVVEILRRIGLSTSQPIDVTKLNLGDISPENASRDFGTLIAGGRQMGIFISEHPIEPNDVLSSLQEGFPVVLFDSPVTYWVFEQLSGSKIEASRISDSVETSLITRGQLDRLYNREAEAGEPRSLIAKPELECATLSSAGAASHAGDDHDEGHHEHMSPLERMINLLKLDARDIWIIALFGLVAGVLSLASPLAVESLVNVVSWGVYLQPLLVLAAMLLACLGIAGVLNVLQTVVVEVIQRRQLVRIVGDLAHRFPRADQSSLHGAYPRELANRVFDIMTIQKASAVLLLDGISIVLTTVMGLLLLAFYHPFLLGFDIALLAAMIGITWALGRGGIRTAIDESITKYRIAHWLQDVLATPAAFKVNGGQMLAVERANRLTADYLNARKLQFRVVIRQVAFAIGLQVIASTALLGLGGWLVITQELTLGQLVASELVVTVIVGAFAKAGKSIEKFYDLMAGMDKVGHLIDINIDPRTEVGGLPDGPAAVSWEELDFHFGSTGSSCKVPALSIDPGQTVSIVGTYRAGKSLLLKSLAGLISPHHGLAQIAGFDAQSAAQTGDGRIVGYACRGAVFHGTIEENVDVGRTFIGKQLVREALDKVGLWETILRLPGATQTVLESHGSPLSSTQQTQLIVARAIAGSPKLLLVDSLLDDLPEEVFEKVWSVLAADDAPWTLIVGTNRRDIAERTDVKLQLEGH